MSRFENNFNFVYRILKIIFIFHKLYIIEMDNWL